TAAGPGADEKARRAAAVAAVAASAAARPTRFTFGARGEPRDHEGDDEDRTLEFVTRGGCARGARGSTACRQSRPRAPSEAERGTLASARFRARPNAARRAFVKGQGYRSSVHGVFACSAELWLALGGIRLQGSDPSALHCAAAYSRLGFAFVLPPTGQRS